MGCLDTHLVVVVKSATTFSMINIQKEIIMSAGILRSKYRNKLGNAKYPFEYFAVFNEFVIYEFNVLMHNMKEIFQYKIDK